jgi:hypothetical protein
MNTSLKFLKFKFFKKPVPHALKNHKLYIQDVRKYKAHGGVYYMVHEEEVETVNMPEGAAIRMDVILGENLGATIMTDRPIEGVEDQDNMLRVMTDTLLQAYRHRLIMECIHEGNVKGAGRLIRYMELASVEFEEDMDDEEVTVASAYR